MQTVEAVAHLREGMLFEVEAGSGHQVSLDLLDDAERIDGKLGGGFSPMEMVLVALAGCVGITVLSIIRKRKAEVTGYELHVHGERASSHPKVFVEIVVEHVLTGQGIKPEAVERAIELAETRYCPVSIMLSKTATIRQTLQIVEA